MQRNQEENDNDNEKQQITRQNKLIELSKLTRSRRIFVYWPNQELKNQFINELAKETTVKFEEYTHVDENEQCSMIKFRSGGIESQKLSDFIKKNPQFKDFQLYVSKQAKCSFEKSFSQSSSSCSSSMNSSRSFPNNSNILNEEILFNDNLSNDNTLNKDLSVDLSPKQNNDSIIISDEQQQQYEQELFLELANLLLINLNWGMSDLYNYIMTSSDLMKKVTSAIVLSKRKHYATAAINPPQQPQFSFIRNQQPIQVEDNDEDNCKEDKYAEQKKPFIEYEVASISKQLLIEDQKEQPYKQQLPTTTKYEQNHFERQQRGREIRERCSQSPFNNMLSRSPSPINKTS